MVEQDKEGGLCLYVRITWDGHLLSDSNDEWLVLAPEHLVAFQAIRLHLLAGPVKTGLTNDVVETTSHGEGTCCTEGGEIASA